MSNKWVITEKINFHARCRAHHFECIYTQNSRKLRFGETGSWFLRFLEKLRWSDLVKNTIKWKLMINWTKNLLTWYRNFGPIYSRIIKTPKFQIEPEISRNRFDTIFFHLSIKWTDMSSNFLMNFYLSFMHIIIENCILVQPEVDFRSF